MRVAIMNPELGFRGGIMTYSQRLCRYLNEVKDVEAKMFVEKYKNGKPDVISVQYEPGCLSPEKLNQLLNEYVEPVVVTAHHMGMLQQHFYPMLDGVVLHAENQVKEKPWSYTVIPHPALVYKEKDKKKLRKKFKLPQDKKIVGTMGFICGTGKILPMTVSNILKNLKDDEFLYLMTPFWKGGDMGRLKEIMDVVKSSGKENNFRIDTDFIADEEILNEKMQCCDLMYSWNNMTNAQPGSQSGSAADMYGARVKLIVKQCPHYSFIGKQDKVLVGREKPEDFADDVLEALRTEDLDDVQTVEWLSWQERIKDYYQYFLEVSE